MDDRIIHYVWLGSKNKPPLVHICINSWKTLMPNDTVFKEWTLDNFPKTSNRFYNECIKRKLWGFASDYIRLFVLYKYGGIYLDADFQLLKPLNVLFDENIFLGLEDTDYIGSAVMGAKKEHPFIKDLLQFYDNGIWKYPIWKLPKVVNYVYTKVYNNEVKLYPVDFFYPFHHSEEFYNECITENTYGIHWWSKNWGNMKQLKFLSNKHLNPIKRNFNSLLNIQTEEQDMFINQ